MSTTSSTYTVLSILCIGYPQKKPGIREKWDYNVIVCEDHYRDTEAKDVSEYWKKFMSSDLKRRGKEISDEEIQKICAERSYGKAYSSHYKEEFVKTTSEKLMSFLRRQGFLK